MILWRGTDVSTWQGNIDWDTLVGKDIRFTYIRAAYGLGKDSRFDLNWTKSIGKLYRGPYLYFLSNVDPVKQVQAVYNSCEALGNLGELPFALDLERNGSEAYPNAFYISNAKKALAEAEKLFGKRPIIYTGPYFAQSYLQDRELGTYRLWVANYAIRAPQVPWPWFNDPFIWQWGSLQVGRKWYGVDSFALDLNIMDTSQLD